MTSFKNIIEKISRFDGTYADSITLVTRTQTDPGDPGLGIKPTYSEAETTINGYIAPYEVRAFSLVSAHEIDADFQLITDTDITNISTSEIKYDDDTYYIKRKDTPKLMPFQDCYIYFLKRRVGQG